jgi:argininosuccinate lyase
MKGLPLAYNKDMQEDKELTFDACDTAEQCLRLFKDQLKTAKFRKDRMERSASGGFTNATDAADYLVGKGVPFRDAHGIAGQMVLKCIETNRRIDDLTMEELKELSPVIEEDFYEAVSLLTCVNKRNTKGAPGQEAIVKEIASCRE